MSENLNKKPPKGILKQSSSFDTQNTSASHFSPRCSVTSLGAVSSSFLGAMGEEMADDKEGSPQMGRKKSAKFDEMNILETLHPPDKDYGFDRIDEPKTPFNYYEEDEETSQKKAHSEILLDPEELAEKIKEKGLVPKFFEEDDGEDGEEEDPEERAKSAKFDSKRKAHYNEYFAVKLARQLMEKEEEEDEEDGGGGGEKFIPKEETALVE